MEEAMDKEWRSLSEEILSGMKEWRLAHPKATLREIEQEASERVSRLQARMVQDVAVASPTADWRSLPQEERPTCPNCAKALIPRGERKRRLQGSGDREVAKDNQPTLAEDIADLFADRTPDRRRWRQAETWDKGHGRLEHRQITCSPDLNDWFAKQWQGIEQVFRLERTTCLLKTGEIRHQVVYGLSNLSLRQVPAPKMLEVVRNHWKIENRLHWRRDVTLGEDTCQTRTGAVPSLLARLNSTVLSLMDRLGVRNVARRARFFFCGHTRRIA